MTNIEFIHKIKSFGVNQLGLEFGDSFKDVIETEFSCNWIYASYPDKLESVFENKFPFEFYPNEEHALKRQSELKKQGYDTYFYHAEAHGGGNCPITKELLSASKARQCYVVLHEAWHVLSRMRQHKFSYSFEESSGRIIGLFGGIEFAKFYKDDKLLKANLDQEKSWAMFADFINESYEYLSTNLSVSDNEQIKKRINKKAKKLIPLMPNSWEKEELKKDINNAFLIRYHDYTVFYPKAKEIYLSSKNLKEAILKFSKITEL